MNGQDRYDVAVVGYGPVGVTAANLLGRPGLRVLVLERDADVPGARGRWRLRGHPRGGVRLPGRRADTSRTHRGRRRPRRRARYRPAVPGRPIGTASPARVVALLDAVHAEVGDVAVGMHFHDTRGIGMANALAAVQAGVTQLDASVGGLGGCPFAPGASGNIATEELVYLLEDAGVTTGVRLDAVLDAARVAGDVVGHELPSGLLRADGRSVPRARPAG